jgi:hypothetical protein
MEQKCGLQRSFKISSVVSEPTRIEERTTIWPAVCISHTKTKSRSKYFANKAVLTRSPRHCALSQSAEVVKKAYVIRLTVMSPTCINLVLLQLLNTVSRSH